MWLIYLRFDDQGAVKTYHVTAPNQKTVASVLQLVRQRGLKPTEKLVEYACFYTRGTIKPKDVPNFHYYRHKDFVSEWQQADAE